MPLGLELLLGPWVVSISRQAVGRTRTAAGKEQLRIYSREALARLLRWIFDPGLDVGERVRERQQHLPDRALSTGLCDVHPSGPAPFADCAVIQLLSRFAASRCLYTVPGRVLGAGGAGSIRSEHCTPKCPCSGPRGLRKTTVLEGLGLVVGGSAKRALASSIRQLLIAPGGVGVLLQRQR